MLLTLARRGRPARPARPRGASPRARRAASLAGAAFVALFRSSTPSRCLNLQRGAPADQRPVRPGRHRASSARTTCSAGSTTSARSAGASAGCRSRPRSPARSSLLRRDWRRARCCSPSPSPVPLHGLAGPLLRPLAAARLPGALRARGLRGGRARHRRCGGRRCSRRSSARCCARRACWRASTSTACSGARTRARRRSTGSGQRPGGARGSSSSRSSPPSGGRSSTKVAGRAAVPGLREAAARARHRPLPRRRVLLGRGREPRRRSAA